MSEINYQCWACHCTSSEITDYVCPRCYKVVDQFEHYHINAKQDIFFAEMSAKLSPKYYYGRRQSQE